MSIISFFKNLFKPTEPEPFTLYVVFRGAGQYAEIYSIYYLEALAERDLRILNKSDQRNRWGQSSIQEHELLSF